ncbi:hypothetical protein PISL3812_05205 [Talaromyces islandicus]|uniref:RING-type E3 ubiquitin transferase n=1 Tax=Talaromyces islandicus TaxID=28573 RepID=A0A0U1LXT7_TALIS|nr:hypothetical protein PISL3812_05205 [Talaromyces islandicus]
MPDGASLQQEILSKTLQEVAHEDEDGVAGPCVICLDSITEAAIAVPCKHANFDFLCLASWLQQRRSCPLCKTEVTAVKYDLRSDKPKLYVLPPESEESKTASATRPFEPSRPRPFYNRRQPRRRQYRPPTTDDEALPRRRHVYHHQLFSLRVGSNRLSQYRELTPEMFNNDENLVSRARKWIRRELQVFEFLNPSNDNDTAPSSGLGRSGGQRLANRRANNAEFLLEYIIAILRTVDIKGSAGHAEDLLEEFIGRGNARLFLHELQSWLRSPYNTLHDWDRHVQYDDTARSRDSSAATEIHSSDPSRRSDSGPPRVDTRRISKHYRSHTGREGSQRHDSTVTARRVQYARNRSRPD